MMNERVTVRLSPEIAEAIDGMIAQGAYKNRSEVVRALVEVGVGVSERLNTAGEQEALNKALLDAEALLGGPVRQALDLIVRMLLRKPKDPNALRWIVVGKGSTTVALTEREIAVSSDAFDVPIKCPECEVEQEGSLFLGLAHHSLITCRACEHVAPLGEFRKDTPGYGGKNKNGL